MRAKLRDTRQGATVAGMGAKPVRPGPMSARDFVAPTPGADGPRSPSSSRDFSAPPSPAQNPPRGGYRSDRPRPAGGGRPGQVDASALAGKVIQGRVDIHPDGFGFLIAKDPGLPNVYLPEETLKAVMHRDEVVAKVDRSFEGGSKVRGSVAQIVRRAQKEILGIYRPFKGGALVIPVETRDRKHAFRVAAMPTPESSEELKAGAAVLCRITAYPDKGQGTVDVLGVVKDPDSPSNDTLRILLEAGWPRDFSRAALSEANLRAGQWKGDLGKRKDLRKLPLVTIDGRDAKDFDDAVCAKREAGGKFRLWVAIADVSFFVRSGTALDTEAFARSTSVYFPDHVVPMLPEVLSNGVCSLNPFEERACLVCECVVDDRGRIETYKFYEGLMKSQRRLTYEEMQAFMDNDAWARNSLAELEPSLTDLEAVFRKLLDAKNKRGAIDLDIPEAKVVMNGDGTILDIQSRERLDAHRLIEECMLAANECAAKFLHAHGDGVYRIHEQPDDRKTGDLRKYLSLVGIDIKHLEEPEDFSNLGRRLKTEFAPDDPTVRAVSTLILRSLKQARYSSERVGHFALANKDYTHFTSPIRRYPDLMVHRLIKEGLKIEASVLPPGMNLEDASRHCSDQERLAMDCERKVVDLKKCRYMEPHLGEEFEAFVTGVTEKGLFCQIEGHFVDGFLSADSLSQKTRYRYDSTLMTYVGPGKDRLGLGARLRVVLASVDISTRRIEFGLLERLS